MDLRRFLDLYVSETQEHVRLLHRSLLALETDVDGTAVDEAFRAAHTLKGLSAAMGYATVTDRAHLLEDRLDEIRSGRLEATGALIDTLLGEADALETAITESAQRAPTGPQEAAASAAGGSGAGRDAVAPPDAVTVALVTLRPDAPIKAARAMLIMRSLDAWPGVLGSAPSEFDDDFDGRFSVFLGAAADAAAVEAAIVGAGEVERVELVEPSELSSPPALRPAGVAAAPAPHRQLRVDGRRVDSMAEGIAELSVLFGRLPAADTLPPAVTDLVSRLGAVVNRLQHDVLALRMVPVREAFERLPRVVRDASRTLGKDVELILEGDDVELDRAILEEIGDPLVHLLRNAVDHGIEAPAVRRQAGKPARGRILLSAERERSSVRIVLSDDGGGVAAARVIESARAAGLPVRDDATDITDDELFRLLSHPGLSTAASVSAVSGRGVGMDVVTSRIRALGGAIDMETRAGAYTRFNIRLPITLALAQALRVRIGNEDYAIPLTHVAEAVELNGNASSAVGRETLRLRGEQLPLVRMRAMLGVTAAGAEQAAVIAGMGGRRAALAVDELVGREQILVKSFDPVAGMLPYFSGATTLADGRPALVLDPLSVM